MKLINLDKIFDEYKIYECCNNGSAFKEELTKFIEKILIEQDNYWSKYLKKKMKENKIDNKKIEELKSMFSQGNYSKYRICKIIDELFKIGEEDLK